MSNIYTLVGHNTVLRHSDSNNYIVMGDSMLFVLFWKHPVQGVSKKGKKIKLKKLIF